MYWDIALGSEHDSKSRWDMPRLPQRAKCSIFWTQLESASAVYTYLKIPLYKFHALQIWTYPPTVLNWKGGHMIIVYLHDDKGGKGEIAKRSPLRNKAKKWNYHVESHPSLVTVKLPRRKLVEKRRLLRFLFRKVVTWLGQSHWQTRVYSTKRKEKKELREEAVTTNK